MARRKHSSATTDFSPPEGPVRTCIGCRTRAAKRELLRVTAGSDPRTGQPVVVPDPDATAPGRGAHLHPTPACYDLAVRRKAFSRALRFAGSLGHAAVGEYLTTHQATHQTEPTGPSGPTETGATSS